MQLAVPEGIQMFLSMDNSIYFDSVTFEYLWKRTFSEVSLVKVSFSTKASNSALELRTSALETSLLLCFKKVTRAACLLGRYDTFPG